jgi:hypothetical protein
MTEKEIISGDSNELINDSTHTEAPMDPEVKDEKLVAPNDQNGMEEKVNEEETSNPEVPGNSDVLKDDTSHPEIPMNEDKEKTELFSTADQNGTLEQKPP